ncbi:MAG: glycosyltransferase family 2 protein [Caldilineaceae bacterium]|nr:glycosyltransferase family 2 protein [Caldilineaceae bacterium]
MEMPSPIDKPPVKLSIKISVIIPTYNRSPLLRRAVSSVLSQTFADFELLIVDDHSSDDTAEAVAEFNDSRIHYIRHEENRGSSATRNTGIRHARGELISFLDDDDEYLSCALAEICNAFKDAPESIGYMVGGIIDVCDTPAGEKEIGVRYPKAPKYASREQNYLSFLRRTPFGTNRGVTFRRDSFEVAGLFDEDLRSAVDRDLFIRFARHFEFATIPKPLVRVHQHAGPQLTNHSPKRVAAYEKIAEKHRETLQKHPRLYSDLFFRIGRNYYRCGAKEAARHALMRSLRKYPFRANAWVSLFSYELFDSGPFQVRQRLLQVLKKVKRKR